MVAFLIDVFRSSRRQDRARNRTRARAGPTRRGTGTRRTRQPEERGNMPDPRYPALYQINTRVWLTELSRNLARARPQTIFRMPSWIGLRRRVRLGLAPERRQTGRGAGDLASESRMASRLKRRCLTSRKKTSPDQALRSRTTSSIVTSAGLPRWQTCDSG